MGLIHIELLANLNLAGQALGSRGRSFDRDRRYPRFYRLTCGYTVELRGLEPLTPTLPVWCATSCAIAP